MKGYFDKIDILSIQPSIKVKGNSRFTTILGKILSLISILSIIIMSMIIIIDVFIRKSYSMIYNTDSREVPSIKINETQIFLLLVDARGKELDEYDRYFNFMVKFWDIQFPKEKKSYVPIIKIMDLPLRNCSDLKYKQFSSVYETLSKDYNSGICIDFSNLNQSLYGSYGTVDSYSTLNIYIRKCINSTLANKTNCFPEDIIDRKLSQIFLSFGSIENDIDSNNFENPILKYYKNDILPLSSTIFKNYFKEMNTIKFLSDSGYFIGNEKRYISYRTERIFESVDLRGKNTLFPGTFSQITLRCSGKTEIYSRKYLKISSVFAEIGGTLNAILLIGKTLIYIFSNNSMISYLVFFFLNYEESHNLIKNDKISSKNNFKIPFKTYKRGLEKKNFINLQKINRKDFLKENKNIILDKSYNNQNKIIFDSDNLSNKSVVLMKMDKNLKSNLNENISGYKLKKFNTDNSKLYLKKNLEESNKDYLQTKIFPNNNFSPNNKKIKVNNYNENWKNNISCNNHENNDIRNEDATFKKYINSNQSNNKFELNKIENDKFPVLK